MHRSRRTKILATLGPASSNPEKILELFEAGADVFRINMSHSSHELLNELVAMIRNAEKKAGRPIGILADLQGPKLRLGDFDDDGVAVEVGDTIT
ncbi:MAG: pyruvate kinase, partial [Pseudomonadota bacterium]